MAQREWVEKDFYKELGVSSDATPTRSRRPTASWLASCIRTRTPTTRRRGTVQGGVRGAQRAVGPAKRKEYDETRRLFAGGGFGGRGSTPAASAASAAAVTAPSSTSTICSTPPAEAAAPTSATCSAACSDAARSRPSQPAAARQRPGDRDRARIRRGRQGRGDAAAADQPGAVHQLPWQRRAAGHQPEGVPELQRRRCDQPQPGRVRLLRAVHRMPGQRLDHRAPLRRVQRHRRHHPHPHHQRADPAGRRGRTADPAGRPGRGRVARRAVGRPVRDRACASRTRSSAATATTSP